MTSLLTKSLDRLERVGNKLPSPSWLFVWLCGLVALFSAIAAAFDWQAQWPGSTRSVAAQSLLSASGLDFVLSTTITNFMHFAPLGSVIVAMLGIGVAERSGLLAAALAALMRKSQGRGTVILVAFAGVLSSLAVDAGYVVLIPLAAVMFQRAGLPPLAGIACAFAGVSGGFSANLMIGPLDAILAGITQEAARLITPGIEIRITANYYFMCVSVLLVTIVVSLITHRLVIPRLRQTPMDPIEAPTVNDAPLLHPLAGRVVAWVSVVYWLLYGLALASAEQVTTSPYLNGIVVVIAFYAALVGWLYARIRGHWQSANDLIAALEDTVKSLASYLVLMFFAAQFIAWFNWTQLGQLLAITGADNLAQLPWSSVTLLLGFVLLTFSLNLFIGSASAKWLLMAPIFVPMLMLQGISPEATQAAYRVGDSTANLITPLMPYFALVLAYVQQHHRQAGLGTVMALMLPYSVSLLLAWGLLLGIWLSLGLPLGPN